MPPSYTLQVAKWCKSSASSRQRPPDYADEGTEAPSDEADGGGHVDEEGENAMATLCGREDSLVGPKTPRHEPDEEDDEQRMMCDDLKVLPTVYVIHS